MGLQFEMKEAVDRTLPEDTIFRAQLKNLELREFSWEANGKTQNGSKLVWTWQIQSPDEHAGRTVRGECDPDLNTGTMRRDRFRPWAEALLGRTIPLGKKLDTDDLVGLSADITVWHRTSKKDPEQKFEEVDLVMSPGANSGWNEPPF